MEDMGKNMGTCMENVLIFHSCVVKTGGYLFFFDKDFQFQFEMDFDQSTTDKMKA